MPTKRCIPLRDFQEGVVEFDDGPRVVPEEYWRFLKPRQTRVEMTYADWLHKVVDAAAEQRLVRSTISSIIAAHMGRR
jgi:hypothetical protein